MSASSLTLAKRAGGTCQGSLIKSIESGPGGPAASAGYLMSSSTPTKVPEYCLLVGVRLTCYESWLCMDKGHPPTSIYSVVGASAVSDSTDASFRVVTNQGTHLWFGAPSNICRDLWLRSLNAGLERYFSSPNGERVLSPAKPRYRTENMKNPPKHCNSCGKLERPELPLILCACPLSQYGMESRMDLCHNCNVAQGLVEHVQHVEELYAALRQERLALLKARASVLKALIGNEVKDEEISDTEPTKQIELSPMSHHKLSAVLTSSECAGYSRISPTLERLCNEFIQGLLGCMEFVELLEHAIGIKDGDMAKLKQEAFRVNGDMGTALRLLASNALPKRGQDDEENNATNQNSTELLQCILEFLLDLLEEGELQSVAFFWPQLLNIHLQMLPPIDTLALRRVELLEDFLLTVSTQYSVQLAIDLIWSHTADLEDSKTLPYCERRRYAVLRFLCELESLLFDFEMGWGGGSVTVGQFLGPSAHQIALLKSGMKAIQDYRMAQPEKLSRSQRRLKLLRDQEQREKGEVTSVPPEQLADEALRVAKNADYLSTHMSFTKRLGDIAYRLFHPPAEKRQGMLQVELSKLNTSGSMGGDPLNRVKKGHDHIRVARIPPKEGHVFRSKERTPVLLLVETLDDEADRGHEHQSKLSPFPKAQALEEKREQKGAEVHTFEAANVAMSNGTEIDWVSAEQIPLPIDEGGLEEVVEEDVPIRETLPSGANETTNSEILDAKEEGNGESTDTPIDEENPGSTNLLAASDIPDEPCTPENTGVMRAVAVSSQTPDEKSADVYISGSEEGLTEDGSSTRHALRRFDSPNGHAKVATPSADKQIVEAMVNNVVAMQLQLPTLMEGGSESRSTAEETGVPANGKDDCNSNGSSNIEHTPVKAAKMTALGTGKDSKLSKTGDARREVLNSLMMKGMSGSHSIATGTAVAMQRHLQDLERRRAVELLLTGGEDKEADAVEDSRKELLKLGIRSASKDDLDAVTGIEIDEDNEVMEAIRLLLIQYQVGQGSLSINDAARVLAPHQQLRKKKRNSEGTMMHFGREFPEIDAGDIDPRLIGCGNLPPAVLQALTLHKANMISNGELLELVKKDLEFVRNSTQVEAEAHKDKLKEDSAFWGRFAFGERWAEKRSRIAALSPDASKLGWDLIGVIVKANDDLRQEAFVMQLIELCKEAFDEAGLELWLLPYRILSTGRTTGIIEMVRNAMSFDALKKRPGYGSGGLREHLLRMTQYAADPGEAFKIAQKNFVRSLAAYSLLSYLFLFKDRHNGNILLDTAGHVIHIDFGFVFGVAPGGSFSLEISTPFKLTEEMIEVMDGLRSSLFSEFITLFCCGFLALQAHCDTFCTVVEISCKRSTFKCFEGRDSAEVVGKLRERFQPDLNNEATIAYCLDLIKDATQSYGTAQYDYFQYLSQGIAA